ncbi:uncharacterized protein ARMOST_19492 [Armillaria ostoyae]|uniref:Uncharacterized protein n=1 Tax=Armillaria ostoyae TaxID=47428 RepID=A0A284S4N4_ARMOS|nr:uncharacterized protein ARMOST_19492 [Armillaria ostoyae]
MLACCIAVWSRELCICAPVGEYETVDTIQNCNTVIHTFM